jgi:hypothetical protein
MANYKRCDYFANLYYCSFDNRKTFVFVFVFILNIKPYKGGKSSALHDSAKCIYVNNNRHLHWQENRSIILIRDFQIFCS